MDERDQKIKEMLLNELIDRMTDSGADRMKPKGLGVSVEAPDKEHLEQGLDHAKSILSSAKEMPQPQHDDGDDEHRLMALLGDEDDDEDKEY